MIKKLLPLILFLLLTVPSIVQAPVGPIGKSPPPVPPSPPLDTAMVLNYIIDFTKWYLTDQLGIPISPAATAVTVVLSAFFGFILPVAGVFLIVYGFLDILKIFQQNWINSSLSIIICLVFLWSGWYAKAVYTIFRISGFLAVVVFALMFISGIWLYKKRRTAEWGSRAAIEGTFQDVAKNLTQSLADKRKEYQNITRRFAREKSWMKRNSMRARMKDIQKEIDNILSRIKELREEYET